MATNPNRRSTAGANCLSKEAPLVILHLIPTLEGGGAERQLAMLACEQASSGASVHIGLRRRGVYAEIAERGGATLHSLGDYAASDLRLVLGMFRVMRRLSCAARTSPTCCRRYWRCRRLPW